MRTQTFTTLLCAGLLGLAGTASAAAPRPNILFIILDDIGYGDLSCYGSETIRTPQLDKLAAQGTKFTSFYAQSICGPSRSALLSGRQPSRSKGFAMPAEETTFAEILQDAGYATGAVGKWDVSSRKYIEGRVPNDQGFDYYWGPLGANDNIPVELWDNRKQIEPTSDMANITRIYTDKAIEWIGGHVERAPEQPFLFYLSHTMGHVVIDASPEFKGRTGNGLYADMMEEVDHEIGRLLATLEELGVADNTLVVFTSDNGAWPNAKAQCTKKQERAGVEWSKGPQEAWGSNGPLRAAKGSVYEGGFRVPAIVRWPGQVPSGKVSPALVTTLDLLPTFTALGGGSLPEGVLLDGVDQTALLTGKSEESANDFFAYEIEGRALGAVRLGKWKLLLPKRKENSNVRGEWPSDFGTNGVELYDLDNDIGEQNNLADQHPEIVRKLHDRAQAYWKTTGKKKPLPGLP